jgi:hypothetical protein
MITFITIFLFRKYISLKRNISVSNERSLKILYSYRVGTKTINEGRKSSLEGNYKYL